MIELNITGTIDQLLRYNQDSYFPLQAMLP